LYLAISLAIGVCSQDGNIQHGQAIDAIRKLGGTIEAKDAAGAPLKVGLTGSRQPAQCMPHLKSLVNLCTLDL